MSLNFFNFFYFFYFYSPVQNHDVIVALPRDSLQARYLAVLPLIVPRTGLGFGRKGGPRAITAADKRLRSSWKKSYHDQRTPVRPARLLLNFRSNIYNIEVNSTLSLRMEYKKESIKLKLKPRIIIHGGAGNLTRSNLSRESQQANQTTQHHIVLHGYYLSKWAPPLVMS